MTDLGDVLHLVGGTAAAFMIFFLPGLLLVNAAIIKESASTADLAALEVCTPCLGQHGVLQHCPVSDADAPTKMLEAASPVYA